VNIQVLFFASLRDISGVADKELIVDTGMSVAELWQQVSADFELLPEKVLCAVNQEYVDTDYQLQDGDQEIAFFPPVTGG